MHCPNFVTGRYGSGHWPEKFCLWFFSSKVPRYSPDLYPKSVSNINSYSSRYSNSKLIPRWCHPRRTSHILQARAGLKPQCYSPWISLRILYWVLKTTVFHFWHVLYYWPVSFLLRRNPALTCLWLLLVCRSSSERWTPENRTAHLR